MAKQDRYDYDPESFYFDMPLRGVSSDRQRAQAGEFAKGGIQGFTTDIPGGIIDFARLLPSGASPTLMALQLAPSSDELGDLVFGETPSIYGDPQGNPKFRVTDKDLKTSREMGRASGVFGNVEGLATDAFSLLAPRIGGGVDAFRNMIRGDEVAVTPDGQVVPVPRTTDQPLPDTSKTAMLASTDTKGINPQFLPGLKRKEEEAQARLEAGEAPRKVFEETGFMRINVDARPDRAPGEAPLETKMVFDIPDNLSQIKVSQIIPDKVKTLVGQNASANQILNAFESLKDSRNYFVERGYKAGRYGRSVQFKLKDVLSEEHPLFDVFPDLKDEIDVRIVEKPPKGAGGFWDKKSNTIAIAAEYLGDDRYTSTLLVHEIMHLLQTRGDLPGGSAAFLAPKTLYQNMYDNFALVESVKFMEGPNFNLNEFITDLGRPKGEQKNLINLIQRAQFNVKNANPAAPDNLSRMWPGNVNSSTPVDLDNMPYADEVKAEMFRLIAEKVSRNDKKIDTLQAFGIDPFRTTDGSMENRSGSLVYSDQAQSNYYRTRGEFMARLAQAYALATEGMSPAQRRKLFPMDLAKPNSQSNFIGPSKDAPGGTEGVMGQDLGVAYRVRAGGRGPMEYTTFVDPSAIKKDVDEVQSILKDPNLTFPVQTSKYGEYYSRGELGSLLEILEGQLESLPRGETPPSEMGLVDIGARRVGEAGGLINVNKLPPEIKSKLEYPQAGIASMVPQVTNTRVKKFGFYQDNPDLDRGNNDYTRENIEYLERTRPEGDDFLRGPQTALLGVDLPHVNVKAEKPFTLPSAFLNDLPGAANETRMAGDPQFDRLMASVKEEGFDPDQKGNRVVVGVNHLGQAYILEGNTRAAVAAASGVPNIRAEVRYFNGAEMVEGPFSPQNLSRIADQSPRNEGIAPFAKLIGQATNGSFSDFNTSELITSWVIDPTKVSREEVASRLLSDSGIVAKTNQALDTKGYGNTVPMFRLVKLTNDGDFQPEELISATLDPNKVPSNVKFLTEGKFGMSTPTDYRLVRYDVPRDRIAGYLPAISGDIKQTVNRAVKDRGIGQEEVAGTLTVTNPAKHAKDLISLQDEIIADVSGLTPTVLNDNAGKPINMLSMGGSLPKLIAEGKIKTPEDISEVMPSYTALNPVKYMREKNSVPFEEAEYQARQELINTYQDFFGIQKKAKGGAVRAGIGEFIKYMQ